MAAWNDLLEEFGNQPDDQKDAWLLRNLHSSLGDIGSIRGDRNVILYASAFLQKPHVPGPWMQLTGEDLNGLMSVIYGMDYAKPLTLVLHTPGGETNAAETLVAYLREKFPGIEVVVPTYAMSAGTMVALASEVIVMGRQSQLGPIDPQMPIPATGRYVSARAIVDQFMIARDEILEDQTAAHAWAPVLQSLGSGILVEAMNALDYGEQMVRRWLAEYMFSGRGDGEALSEVAEFFNDTDVHKSHGRRIDRKEARSQGVEIQDLEGNQSLQDRVLTAYHLATIAFEQSPAAKLMITDGGRQWIKSYVPPS